MKRRRGPLAAAGVLAVVAMFGLVLLFTASSASAKEFATLRVVQGSVEVAQAGSQTFAPASDRQSLREGDTVRTGPDGRAEIDYFDGSITRMNYNTTFQITKLETLRNTARSKIIEGHETQGQTYNRIVHLTDSQSRVEVTTPTATASVQGTVFTVDVLADGTSVVKVLSGIVAVQTSSGVKYVHAGEKLSVAPDGSAGDPVPLTAADLTDSWITFNQTCDTEACAPVIPNPSPLPGPSPSDTSSPSPSPTGSTPVGVGGSPSPTTVPTSNPSASPSESPSPSPTESPSPSPSPTESPSPSPSPTGSPSPSPSPSTSPPGGPPPSPAGPTITCKPHGATSDTSATFEFGAAGSPMGCSGGAFAAAHLTTLSPHVPLPLPATQSFLCSLDNVPFTACTSPKTYPALSEGIHLFAVEVLDTTTGVSVPTVWPWTIDTTAPNTSITTPPSNPSSASAGSIPFTGTDGTGSGVAGFECQVTPDGEAAPGFTPCTSPYSYTLADGTYTFEVRAIDEAGNTDPTPASAIWTIDTATPSPSPSPSDTTPPPDPSIDASPSVTSTEHFPIFHVSDSEGGVTLSCWVDGGTPADCTGGSIEYTDGLPDGSHTFHVQATDAATNTSGITSYTWTITCFCSDPTPVISSAAGTTTAHKDLNGTTPYGAGAGGNADTLSTTESNTWHFDLPSFADASSAQVNLSMVLDDHSDKPASDYKGKILINGVTVFDGNFATDSPGLQHGTPFASNFTNWSTVSFPVSSVPSDGQYTVTVENDTTHTGPPFLDWIGIDSIDVTHPNQPPTAKSFSVFVKTNTPKDINVLAHASGNALEVTSPTTTPTTSDGGNGTVSLNPDGTVNYAPHADFTGTDTFDYTVQDSDGQPSTGTVTVHVNDAGTGVTIQLHWTTGANDLDLHVLTPDGCGSGGSSPCHVWYGGTHPVSWASLDHDWCCPGPPGPSATETTTIVPDPTASDPTQGFHAGDYVIHVDNYACSDSFANTQATVTLTFADGTTRVVTLPQTSNLKDWNVVTLHLGTDGTETAPATPGDPAFSGGTCGPAPHQVTVSLNWPGGGGGGGDFSVRQHPSATATHHRTHYVQRSGHVQRASRHARRVPVGLRHRNGRVAPDAVASDPNSSPSALSLEVQTPSSGTLSTDNQCVPSCDSPWGTYSGDPSGNQSVAFDQDSSLHPPAFHAGDYVISVLNTSCDGVFNQLGPTSVTVHVLGQPPQVFDLPAGDNGQNNTWNVATLHLGTDGTETIAATTGDPSFSGTSCNNAPVTQPDKYRTLADQAVSALAPGLLANDSDPDGDALTASLDPAALPTHGTAVVNPDGSFTYTPDSGFTDGTDQFGYLASDGTAQTPETVTITVEAPCSPQGTSTVSGESPLTIATGQGEQGSCDPTVSFTVPGVTSSTPQSAFITTPHPAWGSVTNANWIGVTSDQSNDANFASNQTTNYDATFDLPADATNPNLSISLLADNAATVYLNGNLIEAQPQSADSTNFDGTTGPSVFPTSGSVPAEYFNVGASNTLEVQVADYGGPNGLAYNATVTWDTGPSPSPTDSPPAYVLMHPGHHASHSSLHWRSIVHRPATSGGSVWHQSHANRATAHRITSHKPTKPKGSPVAPTATPSDRPRPSPTVQSSGDDENPDEPQS